MQAKDAQDTKQSHILKLRQKQKEKTAEGEELESCAYPVAPTKKG